MAAQQTAYVHAGESEQFELGWVDELAIKSDVKDWIKLFVTHDYAECVRRGMNLLPTIHSFEILQMFLISLQRMCEAPAGGGWSAAEVLEQLGLQVLAHHEHDRELHRLLGITLGVRDPHEALALEKDRTARCRIHYYAAARLISAGLHREALPHLDACIDEPGDCHESHLALAHREYDYRAGFRRSQ
jgi:hypothetical protein